MKLIGIANQNKNYYYLVIDKINKNVFAAVNHSCLAALKEELSNLFNIDYIDTDARFYFVFSNTEINKNLIPKKYNKFTILN